ncbi:aminodeoxychorismate synthase, component I [Ammoniphilus sp. CFH 90114]|uniref:aminodeoxychorismate synthase, component I n=1 Tax=Ammoniphilus sp. CFH 90114 TaxID=2493665 RepID=UPI00100DF210|nr:aminodeoxychorismate synthase, component I [Ammoniphilus sp. CFH 90114]RXT09026.1 aminodeoxychorismate synthase, component I [Ammoniphilus sp. CFH 90114]
MIGISKEDYQDYINRGFNVIPLIAKWDHAPDLAEIYELFCPDPETGGLLESGRAGKYSYVAFTPVAEVVTHRAGTDPLITLEKLMAQWKSPRIVQGPDWQGGALGFLSYDLVQHLEKMPDHAHDDLLLPNLMFTVYRDCIAIDHQEKACYLITNVIVDQEDDDEQGNNRLQMMMDKILTLKAPMDKPAKVELTESSLQVDPSFSKEQFEQAVLKVQEYIRSGDVFQVNLSVRQDFPLTTTPWEVYKTLRRINPSPYMAYLHYPDYQVVSASPELLIKLQGSKLSTRPIAGTRPRGKDREEDLRLANELIENEKERAEHIMLVDLERNDLGRVCKYGTVQVTDLMVIEEYSHVMHIVSHVEGELAEGKTAYDAIGACFPGGTITGAPKIRTMEIIEELEPVKRGLYTGSIGWIGFNGDLELNIVIRTLVAKNGWGHVQAGAGIVIDSKPEAEYYESLKKAEAVLKAVQLSQEQNKLSRV